jgi:hypothetical protein
MKQIIAYGKIDNGLHIYNREVFHQEVMDLGTVSHCQITIEYGNKRTVDQNAYLHGGIISPLMVTLNQHGWGYSHMELYRELENNFCKKDVINSHSGEVREIVEPFKEMDTDTFFDKCDRIRDWIHNSTKIELYIKTPAEYFNMTEFAYSRWRQGVITKKQAIEESKDKVLNEIKETFE